MCEKPKCFGVLYGRPTADMQCFGCDWLRECATGEDADDAPIRLKADALLENAAGTMRQRARDYDQPEGERSMGRCVAAFNAITGRNLREAEGWLLLQLLKDARQFQNPDRVHEDSLIDCIAYAALKAEAIIGEQA